MTDFTFIYTEWMDDFKRVYGNRENGILTNSLATKYSNYLTKFSSCKRGDAYTSFRSQLVEAQLGKRPMSIKQFNSTIFSLVSGLKLR
jgi:hypothetical protein